MNPPAADKTTSPNQRVSIDDLNLAVQHMIDGKTHREIAILGGALIEGIMFDLLTRVLVNSPYQKSKLLFDYPRPLSSFGNMLSLAYAFGIISSDEFHMANVIRKVRNHAAHSIGLRDDDEFCFSKNPVREMLFEFYPKFMMGSSPKELREEVTHSFDQLFSVDETMAYRMIFSSTHIRLMARSLIAPVINIPREINEEGITDVIFSFDADAIEAALGADFLASMKANEEQL